MDDTGTGRSCANGGLSRNTCPPMVLGRLLLLRLRGAPSSSWLAGAWPGTPVPALGDLGTPLSWCPEVRDSGVPVASPATLLSALFVQGGRNRLDRWQGLAQASCQIPFPWSHRRLGVGARELFWRQGSLTPWPFLLPSSCPRTAAGGLGGVPSPAGGQQSGSWPEAYSATLSLSQPPRPA